MAPETIDIILPNRIGDTILTLPALLTLKRLEQAKATGRLFRLLTYVPMSQIFNSLELFPTVELSRRERVRSWLHPPDRAYFLAPTTRNFGYRGRITCGINLPGKFVRYDRHIEAFYDPAGLPSGLPQKLQARYPVGRAALRMFALCLDLGYSSDEVAAAFRLDETSFPVSPLPVSLPALPKDYLVLCMEAAYGSKRHNADRRWESSHFLTLAHHAYRETGLPSVCIGISREPDVAHEPWAIDLRSTLSITQTAEVIRRSLGYIGNDTGPLHLANLMRRPSIGVYTRRDAFENYTVLFPRLNRALLQPSGPDEVLPALREFLSEVVPGHDDV